MQGLLRVGAASHLAFSAGVVTVESIADPRPQPRKQVLCLSIEQHRLVSFKLKLEPLQD